MTIKQTRSTVVIALIAAFFVTTGTAQIMSVATSPTQNRVVKVATQSGATVWIDGVNFGKTDKDGVLEIRTVASGGHNVRVRADGFRERTVPLTAAQKGEIKVRLTKTTDAAELAFQEAERLTTVDRDKAADAYRLAIKLRPNFPDAFVGLARVLSETGDLEDAEKAIASAKKFRPAFAEASAVLGRIYKEGGEEEKAIAAFKRSITEGKGFQPEALTGLGLLYKERAEGLGSSGDFEAEKVNFIESAKYLKSALKQLSGAPDALVIYQLIGLVYERMNKFDEAIAIYEEFLRIFPDSVEASAVRSFIVQLRKAKQ